MDVTRTPYLGGPCSPRSRVSRPVRSPRASCAVTQSSAATQVSKVPDCTSSSVESGPSRDLYLHLELPT